ncbi:hypothetical protein ACFQI7_20480 [Paenibacillus allorhizosphaerae]|uniref:DUF2769 domain-containing protein n=1 Tax=Paenibacillus allorhizosphaerae TaxID=2849866 RepID=A0ABM8VKY2_9BACL|nr:hypothetical protein [Paenibacillus allorhizosphaerae]CAG7647657.1 hypothetical protein PAECIP111802_04032 [Paenibacillus allorhizosphaerae]
MNEAISGEFQPSEAAATVAPAVAAAEAVAVTTEMVSQCTYCTMISPDPQYNTPVHCTKLSGSSRPVLVNLATCLSCGEYRQAKCKMYP